MAALGLFCRRDFLSARVPVNSYPNQVVPCQLVPKLTVLSYCCYVMYNTNKNTTQNTQYSRSVKASWRLSLSPDGASEPWSFFLEGGTKKH